MSWPNLLTFDAPIAALLGLILTAAIAAVAMRRGVKPRATLVLMIAGAMFLSLAAGNPKWHGRDRARIVVMVDLSDSTRTADYRDRAALDRRIAELLGNTRYEVVDFEVFEFPSRDADAIVLFSDGRFEPPRVAPPVFAVVDPKLEEVRDAAIMDMELRDGAVAVKVRNSGAARTLTISNAEPSQVGIEPGTRTVIAKIAEGAREVVARFDPGDDWPENDALSIIIPPPEMRPRWWVGESAPTGWVQMSARVLPVNPADYLHPSAIVLQNISARELSPVQLTRLHQYVRDLGGGVVIVGGDRAFASGAYTGTALETISPLSGQPSLPVRQWIVLLDSSGSMAAPAQGTTRWNLMTSAVASALRHIPPDDSIMIGSFAQDLRWWFRDLDARQAADTFVVPRGAVPHGPTNLEPALRQIINSAASMGTELILITDGEVALSDVEATASALVQRDIRMHVLGLVYLRDDNPLRRLVQASGGQLIYEIQATRWGAQLRELVHRASPAHFTTQTVEVRFVDRLVHWPVRNVERWNHTWLKRYARLLAQVPQDQLAMAGWWNVGEGSVAAVAFELDPSEAIELANLVAALPRDPRFTVEWDTGSTLRVTVDAIEEERFMNDRALRVELQPTDGTAPATHAMTQVAPGRYEIVMASPSVSSIASVKHGTTVLERRAIPLRYKREFDHLGNDRGAMRQLAERTGGAVIEPDQRLPIAFAQRARGSSLAPLLAILACVLLAGALIAWRR